MRLARLDLIRYGRFTDTSIELPQGERDLHIVFGPNEAGKTTSLTAIEDLLFGIPERTPYDFRHSYASMLIGAILENGDNRLEFRRRKGRRDMILGLDGAPLPGGEGSLVPFLGGSDRDYFERMFNLSHDRLAEGGKLIVEAKDDVGQMLFSAGTGLADLRNRLKRLEEEADGLWAPRRSAQRLYHQAESRLEDAKSRQRNHSLSANAWRAAHKALRNAEKTHELRRNEYEATSVKLKKLARIRRVYAAVRRRSEVKRDIAALGDVVALAEDTSEDFATAEKREAETKAKLELLASDVEQARRDLEGLAFDDALVRRADDITQLNERRIGVRNGRNDLPKRRDEYERELKELAKLAAEIGWQVTDPAELIERVPSRSKIERVQLLLVQDKEIAVVIHSTHTALEEAQAALEHKRALLNEMGQTSDVSKLKAVLSAVHDSGDVAVRIREARGQVDKETEQIERMMRDLKPSLLGGADIEALAVPPQDTVVSRRDEARDWRDRRRDHGQRLSDARNALDRDRKAYERRVNDKGALAPSALEKARAERDVLWEFVKVRYVQGREIPEEKVQAYADTLDDLPASFEAAVRKADGVADQRFDNAQAAGELAVLARNIAEQETLVEQLEAEDAALTSEGEQLDQAWRSIWKDVPIEAPEPDAMLAWLNTRNDIVMLIRRRREAQRRLTDYKSEETRAIALVQAELTSLGWDTEETRADTLRVMVERAEGLRRDQEAKAGRINEMREAVREAEIDLSRRQNQVQEAQANRQTWRTEWAAAIVDLGLQEGNKPEAVSAQIDVIEQMRERSATARDIREQRIDAIERDIAVYKREVADVLPKLAPDLMDKDADTAILELTHRRDRALELQRQHKELTELLADRQKQVDELEEGRRESGIAVQLLKETAGANTIDDLSAAIRRSDQSRAMNRELVDVIQMLEQQGDGLAIDVLEEECRDTDIDETHAREEVAEGDLKVLRNQLEQAVEARTEARKALATILQPKRLPTGKKRWLP